MGSSAPKDWALDKRRKLQRYATVEIDTTVAARDVCFPGVPLAMIHGTAANGGDNENTTSWISRSPEEVAEAIAKGRKPLGGDPHSGYGKIGGGDLDELGRLGVEGGHEGKPVATDPECPWVVGASSAEVVKVLGAPAPIGGRWHGNIKAQIAVGVWNLRRHLRAIRKRLDPRLQWPEDDKRVTLVRFCFGRMSWSAGSGGAAKHINAYADELAALPESKWWGAFMRCAGREDSGKLKHREDGYTALRAAQAVEGAVLALTLGSDEPDALAWLRADGLTDDERAAVYARLVEVAQ